MPQTLPSPLPQAHCPESLEQAYMHCFKSQNFLKIALAIQGLLCFHTNCKIFCSSSVKNAIGSLIGIALNL